MYKARIDCLTRGNEMEFLNQRSLETKDWKPTVLEFQISRQNA
jgi:hypothetical protein